MWKTRPARVGYVSAHVRNCSYLLRKRETGRGKRVVSAGATGKSRCAEG